MAIGITCPGCDTTLNVAENLVGKTIKCKTCGEMIPVQAPAKVASKRVAVPDDDDDAPMTRSARRRRDDDDDNDFDPPSAKKSSGKGLLFAGIAAGILALLGGGIGIAYFLFGNKAEDRPIVNNAPPVNRSNDDGRSAPATTEQTRQDDVRKDEPKSEDVKRNESKHPVTTTTEPKTKATEPATKTEPKTTAEPPKTAVATPISTQPPAGQSSEEWNRKMMQGEMDDFTLKQCRHATVFIECEDKFGGGGQGSGWFGIENNIVITNAHVISMIAPNSPTPAKLTIYIDSGENGQNPGIKQREIPHQRIKILAVDRTHDIAILEITGEKDLPAPLKVRPTRMLKDRQGIAIMGFPLGSILSASVGSRKQPSISVRSSSVAQRLYDDYGILRNLQVQGGISSGNSGGPQFDAEGYVVGMTVAVLRLDRNIGLAVPTEHIQGLLAGRIDEFEIDTAYLADGKVHIPVSCTTLDPLKRLKKIGMCAWIGETSETFRPPGDSRKGTLPSDKDYQEIELNYDPVTKIAKGEVVLPSLVPGMSYWIQPYYSNAITPRYYLPGKAVVMKGPPVKQEPANLSVQLRAGPVRPFTLIRTSALDDYAEGEGADKENRLKFVSTMKGTETVLAPDSTDSQNAARLRLKYDDADFKIDAGNQEMKIIPPRELIRFKEGIKTLEAFAYVNKTGGIYKTRTNILGAQDPAIRTLGAAMSADCLGSLQECSIPLPNREVRPGETWGTSRTVIMSRGFIENIRGSQQGGGPNSPPGGGRPRPGGGQSGAPGSTQEVNRREFPFNQEMNFQYQGKRTRGGREEAVIKVTGKVTPASGKAKDSASGVTKGFAFVDLSTGVVLDAEIESEFDLDTSALGLKLRTYSVNKYNLTRGGNTR